jgi:hypothetical protein
MPQVGSLREMRDEYNKQHASGADSSSLLSLKLEETFDKRALFLLN